MKISQIARTKESPDSSLPPKKYDGTFHFSPSNVLTCHSMFPFKVSSLFPQSDCLFWPYQSPHLPLPSSAKTQTADRFLCVRCEVTFGRLGGKKKPGTKVSQLSGGKRRRSETLYAMQRIRRRCTCCSGMIFTSVCHEKKQKFWDFMGLLYRFCRIH